MKTTEAAIIANPVAGGGKGRVLAERARDYLRGHGQAVEIHWTAESGQATPIARDLLSRGVKRIAGCGGDGTLNEIANALATSDGALGLFPGGRGNDLCRALGIPRSLPDAADLFLNGPIRRIDLGKVGDRYFNSVAAIGFDAEVCRTVELGHVPSSGRATYVYAILKTLRTYQSPHLKLTGDFGVVEGKIFLAATSNTPTYGGGFKITPPAKMDDGILHVCLIDDLPVWRVLTLLPCVYRGKHTSRPGVRILPTRRLSIESERPLWIYGDGERITQTPAVIEVAPAALQVIAPVADGASGR